MQKEEASSKPRLTGEDFLTAYDKFKAKYATQAELLADVELLVKRLSNWYFVAAINAFSERFKQTYKKAMVIPEKMAAHRNRREEQ
jgi:hypothetical protein